MAPLTTNATRLTLSSHFPRHFPRCTARVEACMSTRGRGDSGCDSDIIRRGEVRMGEKAARAGQHRRHHRCALRLSHTAAA